jgi:predicted GIY-YIG superfamily endonuclease
MGKLVYLIASDSGKYKIGITTTKNLDKRIKQLQTGNSEQLHVVKTYCTEYASMVEKTLHREFTTKKLMGEWFDLEIEDVLTFDQRCSRIENGIQILKEQNNDYILKLLKIE